MCFRGSPHQCLWHIRSITYKDLRGCVQKMAVLRKTTLNSWFARGQTTVQSNLSQHWMKISNFSWLCPCFQLGAFKAKTVSRMIVDLMHGFQLSIDWLHAAYWNLCISSSPHPARIILCFSDSSRWNLSSDVQLGCSFWVGDGRGWNYALNVAQCALCSVSEQCAAVMFGFRHFLNLWFNCAWLGMDCHLKEEDASAYLRWKQKFHFPAIQLFFWIFSWNPVIELDT